MKRFTFAVFLMISSTAVWAQQAAVSPAAQAKAKEAAAKAAWTGKMDAYKLCMAQNVVAERYRSNPPNGQIVRPPSTSMTCTDPGPYTYEPAEPRTIEESGAHSPSETAKSPPSTTLPDAAVHGKQ